MVSASAGGWLYFVNEMNAETINILSMSAVKSVPSVRWNTSELMMTNTYETAIFSGLENLLSLSNISRYAETAYGGARRKLFWTDITIIMIENTTRKRENFFNLTCIIIFEVFSFNSPIFEFDINIPDSFNNFHDRR